MASAQPLIERHFDGTYRLNDELLTRIVSEAKDCQNFALISTFGSNQTLLLNSFVNYLSADRDQRDNWPSNYDFSNDNPIREDQQKNVLVRMWSKPYVFSDEETEQKTAVFLMDSNNQISDMKQIEDIFGLLFSTSSTVVCLKDSGFQVSLQFKKFYH
jgi:hypothetical protein